MTSLQIHNTLFGRIAKATSQRKKKNFNQFIYHFMRMFNTFMFGLNMVMSQGEINTKLVQLSTVFQHLYIAFHLKY